MQEKAKKLIYKEYLKIIIHVHGTISDDIILGVNDIDDISKKTNTDELMVKSTILNTIKSTKIQQVYSIIDSSEIIITFGLSIGESDKRYWQKLLEILKRDSRKILIINAYEAEYSNKQAYKYYRLNMKYLNLI